MHYIMQILLPYLKRSGNAYLKLNLNYGLYLYLILLTNGTLYHKGFLYCIQSNIKSEYILNSILSLGSFI